ncbi:MAG: aldo/keto reductase [Isosphaeraceae bacterium]
MMNSGADHSNRRTFLQAGAATTAGAIGIGSQSAAHAQAQAQPGAGRSPVIPTRKLGKTGVEVTMLDQGAVLRMSNDRLLRMSFAAGVRMFDTAEVYKTEVDFKKWFEREPEVRKQIFLVTKDMPRAPRDLIGMLDRRLETLGTDHVDLFFIHGLGDMHSLDEALNFVTSREFKEIGDAIRKSGKARFVGFSTHHKDRAAMIEAAAKAGTVDAIMMQYAPWLDRDAPLNKALDVAWKKGIGLISMKQIAGKFYGDKPKGDILKDVVARVPSLAEKKLSPFQGLLHAIWTDERITSVCTSMRNTDQIRENTDAARRFEPLKLSEIHELRDAVLASGPTLCADCDGRCSLAAGTQAELGNLTRFLTYHEHLGDRTEARQRYAELPAEARDWAGADLEAARQACPSRLNFASLLPRVERHLA